jgi:hypothetical protein
MRTYWMIPVFTVSLLWAGCIEPEPPRELDSFRMTWGSGPCPPNGDCTGSIELLADGTLRLDTPCSGHLACDGLPPGNYEVVISAADRDAAIAALAAPELIGLLDRVGPVCEPPTDIYEDMTVVVDGVEHFNTTTTCENQPLVRARAALAELVRKYFRADAPLLLGGGWSFGFCQGACVGELGINGAAVRFTMTGHRPEDPVYLDNRGMLTQEGLEAAFRVMQELRDVMLEERYGCPDCADGGASQVIIARDGASSIHTYEFGNPPPELAAVDALLADLMRALETCTPSTYLELDAGCMPRSQQ